MTNYVPYHTVAFYHLPISFVLVRKVCFSSTQKHGLTCGSFIPLHLSTDDFGKSGKIQCIVNRKFTFVIEFDLISCVFSVAPVL